MMKRILAFAAILLLAGVAAGHAANIVILNLDSAGEGFNDGTAAAPVGGNPGITIGQQRLNVFQEAADIWGALLPSAVNIIVEARFNPLNCDASGAVLGAAGAIDAAASFPGAPLFNTWYHIALANRLAGSDLSAFSDIQATFNSSIDNNNNCLAGTNWYYGFDGNEGTDVELLPVVLHELAHGLGFSTFVNLSTGQEAAGFPDVYETNLRDNTSGLNWHQMSNVQRRNSAVNTGNVVWSGPTTTAVSDKFLGGLPVMIVNSPMTLPATMALGTAGFGPSLTNPGITGDIVLVSDGSGTVTDACEPLVNGAQVAGNIALIDRGTCTFVSKAQAAQDAGAIAVIIADNLSASTPPGLGGSGPGITIPVVSITLADGNAIKAELPGVNVTLTLDPSMLAGADGSNRVKVYAPNPLQSGSSISHWDVSATPNLLMEPAINDNLSSSVDLTLAHFADIGWITALVEVADTRGPGPRSLAVLPNYPNPFNPSTSIRYSVAETGKIRLGIYDVQGRLVQTLFDGVQETGTHELAWDGTDRNGNSAGSGVYFVRLTGGGQESSMKIVLVK